MSKRTRWLGGGGGESHGGLDGFGDGHCGGVVSGEVIATRAGFQVRVLEVGSWSWSGISQQEAERRRDFEA